MNLLIAGGTGFIGSALCSRLLENKHNIVVISRHPELIKPPIKAISDIEHLKDDDILALLEGADFRLSKHELSAFFRRPDHKHYRACQEQVLRYFLRGISQKFRPAAS